MMGAESLAHTIAVELAQLTPVELDAFVFSFHPDGLPYKSAMYPDDLDALALKMLERESAGDLLSRIEHILEGRNAG